MCEWRTVKILSAPIPFLLAACAVLSGPAAAQQPPAAAYPDHTVRIVVGFTPGGAPDITARYLAQKLSEKWGQPVIVENKPGAGSAIAARFVAEAAPDGYTLMSITNAHAVAAAIDANLPYDAVKSFAPITMTSLAPNWVLASPSLGVKTLKDFIALAKTKPNQLNFGSAGVGSFMHFAAAIFNDAAGIQAQHVPYKGPPEAIADTVAGRVQYVVSPVGAALGLVRAGKLIPLAVTGKDRIAEFPDVPTVAETGFANFELLTWTGLLAPARTPAPIVAKINAAVAGVLKEPDAREKWAAIGVAPVGTTPDEFGKIIADEVAEFTLAVRKADISVQ